MITVKFFEENKGVVISGHSGYAEEGSDIICASVSSAIYMVANTITEVIGADIDVKINDGFMDLRIPEPTRETDILIEGLKIHIGQLSQQYPQYVITQN